MNDRELKKLNFMRTYGGEPTSISKIQESLIPSLLEEIKDKFNPKPAPFYKQGSKSIVMTDMQGDSYLIKFMEGPLGIAWEIWLTFSKEDPVLLELKIGSSNKESKGNEEIIEDIVKVLRGTFHLPRPVKLFQLSKD